MKRLYSSLKRSSPCNLHHLLSGAERLMILFVGGDTIIFFFDGLRRQGIAEMILLNNVDQ